MSVIGAIETHVAHKQHTCSWCGGAIEPGEKYARWRWKDGDTIVPVKAHEDCWKAWDREAEQWGDEVLASGEARRGMIMMETEEYDRTHA